MNNWCVSPPFQNGLGTPIVHLHYHLNSEFKNVSSLFCMETCWGGLNFV